jgi:hypothetical protein
MGWHSGIVAARAPWDAFAPALHELAGIAGGDAIDLETAGRDTALGGEHAGRSYVLDPMMLTSTSGDLVVALARTLDTLVIGVGAETISGSSWLFVAERDRVLRVHWACAAELAAELDDGDWHRELAMRDVDGYDVYAALERGGFDLGAFLKSAPKRRLLEPEVPRARDGAIAAKIAAFCTAHDRPADRGHPPVIVVRRDPS